MKKRGQITLFVIMGIVLLIVAGLLIAVTKTASNIPDPTKELEHTFEESAIKLHVESCLQSIASEGLRKLGDNGGYINPEEFGFVSIEGMPTSSSALEFAPGSGYLIPYWHYMKSSNSCTNCFFDSKKPPLDKRFGSKSVEMQLKKYVDNHIENCLDLNQFQQYEVETIGFFDSDVTIGESDLLISARYPIQIISNTGSTQIVSNYKSSLDIDLKKFFELADSVLEQIIRTGKIEQLSAELISINSMDGSIPPLSGEISIDLSGSKMWVTDKVRSELEIILADMIPTIQMLGSRNSTSFAYPDRDEYFEILYKNYVLQIQTPYDIADIKFDFLYLPWWDIYLKVTPGSGALIMTQPLMSFFIIPISMQENEYDYDLSYPVILDISDETSLNHEGFSLKIAFEVNMRNNNPFSFDLMRSQVAEESNLPQRSFMADPNHWNSGNITIKTMNTHDDMPIDNVILTFSCLNDEIFLGKSVFNEDGDAEIQTKLPICIGANIFGFKNDYFVTTSFFDTELDVNDEVIVHVEPKKRMNVTLKEKIVGKTIEQDENDLHPIIYWEFRPNSSRDVGFTERVVLILERLAGPGEEDFVAQVTYMGNQTETPYVDLVTGQYKVEGFRFASDVVIPPKEYCDEGFLNTGIAKDCQWSDEIAFNDSFYSGGLIFDNETFYGDDNQTIGYFNVNHEDIQANEVTIFLLAFDENDFWVPEDLEEINKMNDYIIMNKEQFYPIFGEE